MVSTLMKSLLLLALGGVCGVLITVLFFTIDPTFRANESDGAGGGNVTLVLNERALAILIAEQLPQVPAFGEKPQVEVTVGTAGIIKVEMTLGTLGVGLRSSITLDPNIVDGRLHLDVVESALGEIAAPEVIAGLIEQPIQARLDALAGGLEYRLTSIRTTDRRLALEIAI
jgi:hypothetical protein